MAEYDSQDSACALADADTDGLAGKYLTFMLADEHFGLPILQVREIIGLMDITPVPRAPAHFRGVINLRGKIIPVVDLRRRFEFPPCELHERNCIVVVEMKLRGQGTAMGILVDSVSEVLDIPAENIEPPPDFGCWLETEFILGMAKTEGAVRILLSIEYVLGNETLPTETEKTENG